MTAKIKNPPTKSRHKTKPRGVARRDFEKVYWPYIPVILVVGLLFSLGIQSGVLQAKLKNPASKTLDYALSMNMERLLEETNSERGQNGLEPLRLNSKLYAAAQAKADDMAKRNYWSHYTPDGQAPWVFVQAHDYAYQKLGENLATGFLDENGTVKGWMASEGHRKNLLDPIFTEVGFGVANIADYSAAGGGPMTIIVAMYGRPTAESATKPADIPDPVEPEAVIAANTDNLTPSTDIIAPAKLSGVQLALANMQLGSIITGLLIIVMFAAICLWLTKHAYAVRKAIASGESFVIHHPLLDVGLIIIIVMCLLLTKTAGLVG